jgi:methyl-accepting chemotaxis protein
MKDPNGLALFKAFVAQVQKEGKGFVGYQWPKPGSEQAGGQGVVRAGLRTLGLDDRFGRLRGRPAAGPCAGACGSRAASCCVPAGGGYLFLSFYRVMDGGLKETRRHLRAMTDGDLTTSPSPWGRDEAAQLMLELRAMQDSLRGMVLRGAPLQRRHRAFQRRDRQRRAGPVGAHRIRRRPACRSRRHRWRRSPPPCQTPPTHTDEASRVARHNARRPPTAGEVMQRRGADDGRHPRLVGTHRRDHRHHRQHRLPDQHPGAQRRGRGRPRRRAGPRLSRWWPARCARWPSAAPTRRARSRP